MFEKVLVIGLYWIVYGGFYDNIVLVMNIGKIIVYEVFWDVVDVFYVIRNDFIKFLLIVDEMVVLIVIF